MKPTLRYGFILLSALVLGGCRQADGPLPTADAETQNDLVDVGHDLQNVAKGDPQAPKDLADDLRKYPRRPTAMSAVAELTRRTVTVLAGKQIDDQTAQRLSHSLWTSVAARELSDRQVETLQNEVQSILMSAGVVEDQAQQVAAQVGEVQKQVSNRPRRWYEFF
jgi:hypothetical protein